MPDDDLELRLVAHVMHAGLPPAEPFMHWVASKGEGITLKVRAHDHALLVDRCEYHCLPRGRVEVKDYTDPRSMRSQVYDPQRPGQPYMAASIEDTSVPPAA